MTVSIPTSTMKLSNTDIKIRKVQLSEVGRFLDIGLEGLLEYCDTDELKESTKKYHKMHRSRSESFLKKSIESEWSQYNKQAWVAVHGKKVVGTIKLKPRSRKPLSDRSSAEIDNVSVLPKYRRLGVASKLLSVLEDHATKHRIGSLHLITQNNLTSAIKFYESKGYTMTHQKVWNAYTLMYYKKETPKPIKCCKKKRKLTFVLGSDKKSKD